MPKTRQTQWPSVTKADIKDKNLTIEKLVMYKDASVRIMLKHKVVDAELKNGGLCSASCVELYTCMKQNLCYLQTSYTQVIKDTVAEFLKIESMEG